MRLQLTCKGVLAPKPLAPWRFQGLLLSTGVATFRASAFLPAMTCPHRRPVRLAGLVARAAGGGLALVLLGAPALAQQACKPVDSVQQQRFDAFLSSPTEREEIAASCARQQVRDQILGQPPGTALRSPGFRRSVLDRIAITTNGTLCQADLDRLADAYIQAVARSCR